MITSGCVSKQKSPHFVSKEEHKWLRKFFEDILLEQGGIYVLFGSKPMVSIDLYCMTEEEASELTEIYKAEMTEEEKQHIYTIDYDLNENWDKWNGIKDRFPIKRYLIFAHLFETDDPRFQKLYLVDILKTAQVIHEHYALFREFAGYDFDPFEMVFRIQNREDPFWLPILHQDAILFGILMGYGQRNSVTFKWYSKCYLNDGKGLEYFHGTPSAFCDGAKNYKLTFEGKNVSIKHFPIPVFRSFADEGKDEVVEKYKKEREDIKKHLKKNDFVELALEKLCS